MTMRPLRARDPNPCPDQTRAASRPRAASSVSGPGPRVAVGLASGLLLLGATATVGGCSIDSDSKGGMPSLAGSTGPATESHGDASSSTAAGADDTASIPEGPRRRRLDVATELVGEVGGHTLLVVLDPARIEYDDTQSDGSDLQFFSADGSTRYPAEIEHWEPGGTSYVWVYVSDPTLPDHLWMHYADGMGFPPDDPAEVWDGAFDAVWHMKADGTSIPDSSGSDNPLVARSFMGELQADGAIGPGVAILGSLDDDGPLEVSELGTLAFGPGLTVEAWVSRPDPAADTGEQAVVFADRTLELRARESANNRPSVVVWTSDQLPHRIEGGGSTGAAWTYLAATYQATDGTLRLYRNGQSEMTTTVPEGTRDLGPLGVLRIGVDLFGSVDEVRISSFARAPSWFGTQHASMVDDALTFGPPQPR